MSEAAIKPDLYLLKRMQPMADLPPSVLQSLSQQASIKTIPGGEVIFRAGEHDSRTVFLIDGKIDIITDNDSKHTLSHNSPLARQALSLYNPRPVTAVANTRCSLLVLEQAILDKALGNQPNDGYEIEELSLQGDRHTFSHLLNSPDLLELPPEDVEVVLSNVERIDIERGQVMIWQGDNDPWYYTILQGQARVTRMPSDMSQEIVLAELGAGSRFGEESLITGKPRNATVTMMTDGTLLRLHGDIFVNHVVKSFVPQLEYNAIIKKLKTGAQFIDVRNEDVYRENGYGVNIPLPLIRLKLGRLDPEAEYIMACNDGRQSLAAAFLAKRHGLNVSILKEGLHSVNRTPELHTSSA